MLEPGDAHPQILRYIVDAEWLVEILKKVINGVKIFGEYRRRYPKVMIVYPITFLASVFEGRVLTRGGYDLLLRFCGSSVAGQTASGSRSFRSNYSETAM